MGNVQNISDRQKDIDSWLTQNGQSFPTGSYLSYGSVNDITDLSQEGLRNRFTTDKLNADFVSAYNFNKNVELGKQGKVIAPLKAQIDYIRGLRRSTIARYKSRLEYFADDFANKNKRTKCGNNIGFAKLQSFVNQVTD